VLEVLARHAVMEAYFFDTADGDGDILAPAAMPEVLPAALVQVEHWRYRCRWQSRYGHWLAVIVMEVFANDGLQRWTRSDSKKLLIAK